LDAAADSVDDASTSTEKFRSSWGEADGDGLDARAKPLQPGRHLIDHPELRHTEGGIARAMFRVAVSGRREQEPSFLTAIVWRDQAEHASESLAKGRRVAVVGPAPAADLDRRGRQHPLDGRSRG
jgi:Single-strand binding protein family